MGIEVPDKKKTAGAVEGHNHPSCRGGHSNLMSTKVPIQTEPAGLTLPDPGVIIH